MPNRTQVRHGPGGVVTVTSRHRSRIWCPVRSSVHTRRPPRNARAVPSLRVRIMIIAHPVIDAVLRRRFAHGTSSGDVRTNGRTSATPPRGASNRHHERDINHAAPCADVIGRRPLRETGRKRTTARARVAFFASTAVAGKALGYGRRGDSRARYRRAIYQLASRWPRALPRAIDLSPRPVAPDRCGFGFTPSDPWRGGRAGEGARRQQQAATSVAGIVYFDCLDGFFCFLPLWSNVTYRSLLLSS